MHTTVEAGAPFGPTIRMGKIPKKSENNNNKSQQKDLALRKKRVQRFLYKKNLQGLAGP